MDSPRHQLLDELLITGTEQLDLTQAQHERAVAHYQAVGKYLAHPDSPLAQFSPIVFPQGSIAIGTATKPLGRDEFDLDLTCQLNIQAQANPARVKAIVGERLRAHETYRKMLEEKNRCWRLVYAGEFHMDIIASIPNPHGHTATAALVPDRALRCWKETDPKAYAEWFLSRGTISAEARQAIARDVEPAPASPDKNRKLPLQVIVQLLKRHRDLMFPHDEHAPISIIITTLAALAYDGSPSVVAALRGVIDHMPLYISRTNDGVAFVANPVSPAENFADKWSTHPVREERFSQWVAQVRRDLKRLQSAFLADVHEPLGDWIGDRAATIAIKRYADRMHRARDTGLAISAGTGHLASTAVHASESPKHTFFGH